MSWTSNKQAPLDEETQKAVIKALCDRAGKDLDPVDEHVAYVPQNIVKDCQGKFGTICGTRGNTFSFGMVELLKKCCHFLMLYRRESGSEFGKRESSKVLIVNMAVVGLSRQEAVKLALLAKLAGGSLKEDFLKVGNDEWAIFESR